MSGRLESGLSGSHERESASMQSVSVWFVTCVRCDRHERMALRDGHGRMEEGLN